MSLCPDCLEHVCECDRLFAPEYEYWVEFWDGGIRERWTRYEQGSFGTGSRDEREMELLRRMNYELSFDSIDIARMALDHRMNVKRHGLAAVRHRLVRVDKRSGQQTVIEEHDEVHCEDASNEAQAPGWGA